MTDEYPFSSEADFLANVIKGKVNYESRTASVQRSHRFPIHIYAQMENLARISQMPVSMIINQLLECGLEALEKELPPELAGEVMRVKLEQLDRPLINHTFRSAKKRRLFPGKKSSVEKNDI